MSNTKTAKRTPNATTILNYLAKGKSLTKSQAAEQFGIRNFNSCMAKIAVQVEKYGNWTITTHERPRTNETAYSLQRVIKNRRGRVTGLSSPVGYWVGYPDPSYAPKN